MSPRRYAEDTSVPIARSRGQIDDLLREWGCSGLQWTDDFDAGSVTLRFRWSKPDLDRHCVMTYTARFMVQLATEKTVIAERGRVAPAALRDAVDRARRAAFRVLLLWLKAAFNAVEAGIIEPEVVFLPFLEGKDGRTVAEVAVPALGNLLTGSAARLLGAGAP